MIVLDGHCTSPSSCDWTTLLGAMFHAVVVLNDVCVERVWLDMKCFTTIDKVKLHKKLGKYDCMFGRQFASVNKEV